MIKVINTQAKSFVSFASRAFHMGSKLNNLNITRGNSRSVEKRHTGVISYISIALLPRYIKLLVWLLNPVDPSPYFKMGARIERLYSLSGPLYTVKYLKEATRIVQHFIAGEMVRSSLDAGLGLSGGLPKLIPGSLRLLIRQRDPISVRLVLSVLSVFRILRTRPNLKLETITGPFDGLSTVLPDYEVRKALAKISNNWSLLPSKFLMLNTAGPNNSTSVLGLPLDALAFSRNPLLLDSFKVYSKYSHNDHIWEMLEKEISIIKDRVSLIDNPKLGKLSFKEEAAGKVRVFAITDGWTQSLFSGLHDSIFRILKLLPQDGTFNQAKPLQLLLAKKPTSTHSFDLSAATDRLPIDLQVQILSILTNVNLANSWKSLMVDREWSVESKKYGLDTKVKYSVGQPMGALSSWGMLALTHHIIVQIAANRAGKLGWFEDYALLGDDIVITDSVVASVYHNIMTEILGVKINLSKSLVSEIGVMEFAKRLIDPVAEYTPVGPKNLLQAMRSYNSIPSLFTDIIGKGFVATSTVIEERFKALPLTFVKGKKHLKDILLWTVQGPFGIVSTGVRLTSNISSVNSYNPVYLSSLLTQIRLTRHSLFNKEWQVQLSKFQDLYFKVIGDWKEKAVPGFSQLSFGELHSYELVVAKYKEGYTKLLRAKPFINPMTLSSVDMLKVYTNQDIFTPEFNLESPTALVMNDIFIKPKVKFTQDLSKPSKLFFAEFLKQTRDENHPLAVAGFEQSK